MARLFGFLGNRTDLGAYVVQRHRELLRSRRLSDERVGWGVGFFQSGEVLLRRRPHDDREIIDPIIAAEQVRTDLLIAHVRRPGVGGLRTENTQPFRYRAWLFAQTGSLPRFDVVRQSLSEELPEFLRRNIRGDTDGELMFYMLLAALQSEGHLSDLGVSASAVRAALRATAAALDRVLCNAGFEPPRINVMVSNGECFVALHRGEPMALKRFEGVDGAEDLIGEQGPYQPRVPNLDATRFSVLVSDYADPTPDGFEPVESDALITLHREAPPEIEAIGQSPCTG